MNDNASTPPARASQIPFLILGAALALFFVWHVYATVQEGSFLRAQHEARAKVLDDMKINREQRQAAVQQSRDVQGELEKIVNDLLTLARTDPEAQALVERYGISRQTQ